MAGRAVDVVCLAGPPVGSALFRHVAPPLTQAGFSVVAPELFEGPERDGSIAAVATRLAPAIPKGAVVLAHGLAVPLALKLAEAEPLAGLVLVSGPIRRLDPITWSVARMLQSLPPSIRSHVLRPQVWLPLLASSVALRRTVNNPYVMDRDIVDMLCGPLLRTRQHRSMVASYLVSMLEIGEFRLPIELPALVLYGASNQPYSDMGVMSRSLSNGSITAIKLVRGRFFSIEERPWEVAEALISWALKHQLEGTVTQMSRISSQSETPSVENQIPIS